MKDFQSPSVVSPEDITCKSVTLQNVKDLLDIDHDLGLEAELLTYLPFGHLEVISHDKDHLHLLLLVLLLPLAVLAFIRRRAH
jgi:hypothetical protein